MKYIVTVSYELDVDADTDEEARSNAIECILSEPSLGKFIIQPMEDGE